MQKNSDKGGTDDTNPVTVTAVWDFTTQPTGFPTSDAEADAVTAAGTWTTTSGGKWLTLTLAGKAKATLKYAGAGASDAKRFVAVVSGSTVTWGTDSSGIDTTEATKELTLEKGEYTIAMNGSRIYTITCEAAE